MHINLVHKKIYYDIDIKTNYSNLKDSPINLFIVMVITIQLIWKKRGGWFYEEIINHEQSETKTIVIICQDSVEWQIIMVWF